MKLTNMLNKFCLVFLLYLYNQSFCYGSNLNQSNTFGTNDNESKLSKYWYQLWNQSQSLHQNNLTMRAQSIGSFLKLFVHSELNYNETKNIFEVVSFDTKRVKSLEEKAKTLGETFGSQLKSYNNALERLANSIDPQNNLELNGVELSKLPNCCDIPIDKFEVDERYRIPVLQSTACWTASTKGKSNLFIPNQKFTQAIHQNLENLSYIKWMYFLSPEGTYVEYPANNHNCKNIRNTSRTVGTETVKDTPERKLFQIQKSREDMRVHRIVFLIELDQNPTADSIRTLKNIVLMLLRFLDESDEVAIINSELDQASFLCDQLVPLTGWTRYQILNYLNKIELRYKSNGFSQQTILVDDDSNELPVAPIQRAMSMACANFSEGAFFPPPASTIIHLTSENSIGGNRINFGNINVSCPIFIETYFLKNLTKNEEVFYKKSLQTIETKNILRVEVFSSGQTDPDSFAVKVALKLNSKKEWWSLSDILSNFFPQEKWSGSRATSNDFSLPQWNPITQEPVLLAKKYVLRNQRPFGLLAIEIPLHYFAQHISFYVEDGIINAKNYAFLIDMQGRVIYHPSFEKPNSNEDILSIRIEQVEVYHGFHSVRKRILGKPSGCFSMQVRTGESTWITYAWSHVEGYIVVIVAYESSGTCVYDREEVVPKKSAINPKSTDIQHYLLLQSSHCCSNRSLNMDKASLYLSPTAFNFPASTIVTPQLAQAVMAYLSDSSGMLKNQNRGLRNFVKDYIGVVSNVVPLWKQSANSDISKYVSNRFITAAGGTFLLMHPGKNSIQSSYLPHRTEWYQKAVSHEGKLVFLPPVIDSYGTPRTIASVLLNTANSENLPVAVLGLTLSYGLLHKIIEGILPSCEQGNQAFLFDKPTNVTRRCFLIDENGYVVYHPHLLKSLNPLSKIHFTQVEPLTAIDLLQYGQSSEIVPMQKKVCHKLGKTSQGSLHRQYTMEVGQGVQKYKYGELCSRYQIIGVPETNLLLGVVEDGCENHQAFCPCSTVDNLCLNCIRIEKTDCECPCECPREPNICSYQDFSDLPRDIVPCEFPLEETPMTLDKVTDCTSDMTSSNCKGVWVPCINFTQQSDCVGAYDCDWCAVQNMKAACYSFRECLGFDVSDLKSLKAGDALSNPLATIKTSDEDTQIILPVLGVLSVFIVFIIFVFYCYHRNRALNSSSSQPDLRLLPLDDGSIVPQAPSSQADESEDDTDYVPLAVVRLRRSRRFHENRFLPPPRSPSSDHGYSTMTHGGESEASGPVLDQNSIQRSLYGQTNPDFPSIRTDYENQVPTTSILPHQLVIPVTVHEECVS